MKVRVLPASLADKIAAGEVVERPASVVKELVENSLDAGATNISVEIKRGGITFIRVTDDGHGMQPEDAKLAFLRHATSKIAEADDLNNILTYGFRGEALAAICAVSKVELITCTNSQSPAYFLSLEGGEIVEEDEIGAPLGTSVIIRDLFYNTPARLHFMKKDSTEAAAVATMLQRIAIGRYDVSFTLISDQKVVFRTMKTDDMKNVIHSIYGPDISTNLLSVNMEYNGIAVSGYCCKQNVMRSNRNLQFFYLNGRYIKSKQIYSGIDNAYATSKETGKYPVCFLKFSINPKDVDVNVHPAKLEVKFKNEQDVFVIAKYSVAEALVDQYPFYVNGDPNKPVYINELFNKNYMRDESKESSNTASFITQATNRIAPSDQPEAPKPRFDPDLLRVADSIEAHATEYDEKKEKEREIARKEAFRAEFMGHTIKSTVREEPYKPFQSSGHSSTPKTAYHTHFDPVLLDMHVIGEIFKTYILLEYEDALYLVDKHAAHEKMIYNELLAHEKVEKNQPRQYITPTSLVLPPDDMDTVLRNQILFAEAGFEFCENDANSITLRTIPGIIPNETFTDAFQDVLETIQKNSDISQRKNEVLKRIACHSSIRGGSVCTIEEVLPLIRKLLVDKDLNYCPHGRPIMQRISRKEINKMFKRG